MRLFLVLIGTLALVTSWAQGVAGRLAPLSRQPVQFEFGDQPEPTAVAKGYGWGAMRKGIWRPGFEVQRGITRWFSGIQLKPIRTIEYAWWFSPGFVSSRFGYLAASEYWNESELQKRWSKVSKQMQGQVTLFVQLASVPKYDLIEDEYFRNCDISDIEDVRFVLLADRIAISPKYAVLVREETSRSSSVFVSQPWHLFAPGAEYLLSEFESPSQEPGLPLGAFEVRIYRVDFKLDDLRSYLANTSKISLRILSANRERRVEWSLK